MQINASTSDSEGSEEKVKKVEGRTLREVTVKIRLERIDTQEGITVEVLFDSRVTGLVMSSEFTKKQGFKLKKLERLMNVRNVNGSLNKEGPIENTVEFITTSDIRITENFDIYMYRKPSISITDEF